jgi:DNA-3-methyladenine glycosylase I
MEEIQILYRCKWAENNQLMQHYHDTEWGNPVHDDVLHFEFMVLDAFQAGLSWLTILKKRENFRLAFDNFNFIKIAKYNNLKIGQLMANEGIIRNKLKIEATVNNANRIQEVIAEFGSFDNFIWKFVNHKTIQNKRLSVKEVPAKTEISDKMSKELLKRGFKFVGSTICYSYMQAAGMVNDHEINCFRYSNLKL